MYLFIINLLRNYYLELTKQLFKRVSVAEEAKGCQDRERGSSRFARFVSAAVGGCYW